MSINQKLTFCLAEQPSANNPYIHQQIIHTSISKSAWTSTRLPYTKKFRQKKMERDTSISKSSIHSSTHPSLHTSINPSTYTAIHTSIHLKEYEKRWERCSPWGGAEGEVPRLVVTSGGGCVGGSRRRCCPWQPCR